MLQRGGTWASLALVLLAGAATMLTHDPRCVMIKPTLIYIVLGLVMLQRGWMTRYIPAIAVGYIEDVTIRFGAVASMSAHAARSDVRRVLSHVNQNWRELSRQQAEDGNAHWDSR